MSEKMKGLLSGLFILILANCSGDDDTNKNEQADNPIQNDETKLEKGPEGNEFISIGSGNFDMGISYGEKENKSYANIKLSSFKILRYEVSAGEYKKCVEDQRCEKPGTWGHCTYDSPGLETHPVNCVAWEEARNYCAWLGGDLPTEAQWEYAARGTDRRKYPWGNELPSSDLVLRTNCQFTSCKDDFEYTSPVGSFSQGRSSFKVYDMAGNVAEWVRDYFTTSFFEHCTKVECINLYNYTVQSDVVIRGGSYMEREELLTTYARTSRKPYDSNITTGFRCVKEKK